MFFQLSEEIHVDYEQSGYVVSSENTTTILLQLLPLCHVQVFGRNLFVVNL